MRVDANLLNRRRASMAGKRDSRCGPAISAVLSGMVVSLAVTLCGMQADAEEVSFRSYSPDSYREILDGSYRDKPVELSAQYSKPAFAGPHPAIIILPGSGGVPRWIGDIVDPLGRDGYATLVVDSFNRRGVRETATDQSRVSIPASVTDGFAALAFLGENPDIDPRRIGIVGFSRGGVVAMFTAEERLARAVLPSNLRFAAHAPFYPGCSTLFLHPVPTSAPIQFFLGGADEYTPAAKCLPYIDQLKALAAPVAYNSYEGANHAWMAQYPP